MPSTNGEIFWSDAKQAGAAHIEDLKNGEILTTYRIPIKMYNTGFNRAEVSDIVRKIVNSYSPDDGEYRYLFGGICGVEVEHNMECTVIKIQRKESVPYKWSAINPSTYA